MKQTCILVLGMHRSGTSALTGLLSLLDVHLGSELMKANFANEKGYFENEYIVNFNDKILKKLNSSWDDIFFDYDLKKDLITQSDIEELKNIMLQEFSSNTLFAIKDPRICYLFPLYEEVLKGLQIEIKILLPYRNPIEVSQSLEKRDNFSLEKSIALWLNHFLEAELRSREYPRYFLKFDNLLNETEEVIKKIDKFLGINIYEKYMKNKTKIDLFLEVGLKHNNLEDLSLKKGIRFILQDFLKIYHEELNKVSKETFDLMYYKNSEIRLFYKDFNMGLRQELNNTKEELNQTKQELNQTKQELIEVYTSKSWKATRPLRAIMRVIKK